MNLILGRSPPPFGFNLIERSSDVRAEDVSTRLLV